MNVFGKRERSWRKARKRGVSPIIATILLVAITVVLAAVLYVLISGLTTGGANTVPIGTTFAFGQAQQVGAAPAGSTVCPGTVTAGTCYSIGIQSAGASATTANIHFAVQLSGSAVKFTGVDLIDGTGTIISTYTPGSGWSTSSQPFASTDTLVVGYTSSLAGDSLVAQGVGALSGTTPVALP